MVIGIFTDFCTLVSQSGPRKLKISQHSKLRNSKNPGREKAFHFKADINITSKNYSFMPKDCFKLLLRTSLMSDLSHLPKKIYLAGIHLYLPSNA